MITIDKIGGIDKTNHIEFVGLSTDTKPTDNVVNGSIFKEVDTSDNYVYDAEHSVWIKNNAF